MKVIVGERRTGRTTKLVNWLLEGKEQDTYPYWSRVIVCPTHPMTRHTTNMVLREIEARNWNPCDQMLPHMHRDQDRRGGRSDDHSPVLTDVKKAVWSLGDLDSNLRGSRDFEFAMDDYDQMMLQHGIYLTKMPTLIVVEGELYDPGN